MSADVREDLSQWSVARMASLFTPRQAAKILAQSLALQLMVERDEHTERLDRELRWDAGHQWFLYCLTAVARRA